MKEFSLALTRAQKARELPEIKGLLAKASRRNRGMHVFAEPRQGMNIIAEFKPASPSGGVSRSKDIAAQLAAYEEAGAAGISVLTDRTWFSGSWNNLQLAAQTVNVPLLCKEFVYFNEQIDLAARSGADYVLLIARALAKDELKALYQYALQAGLRPLVEVHQPSELDDALALDPQELLVNLRDLETLRIEEAVACNTLKLIPKHIFKISASGMQNADDIRRIYDATGARTFLAGTALMNSADPEKLLRELVNVG
jgi:indole-3-glycerol phosphate synthase